MELDEETYLKMTFREQPLRQKLREVPVSDYRQFSETNREIVRLASMGLSNKQIARLLDRSEVTVSRTLNSSIGIAELSKLREKRNMESFDFMEEVRSTLLPKCSKTYNEILDKDDISYELKKKTADTIALDICGHRAPTKVETFNEHYVDNMEELRRRGREAMKTLTIDVESVVVNG